MSDEPKSRSTATLVSDAMAHVSGLVRKEIDLAKAEVNENVTRAAAAVGLLVGAIVVVLVALNVLSAALVAGLTELGLESGWAALIVGVVYLLIAIVMVRKGMNDLKATSLAPTRTAANVRHDALAMKETLNG